MQAFLQGPIRAMGKQGIASVLCLASYYIVALPLALVFCFFLEMGIAGLWLGMIFGIFLQSVAYALIVIFSDWQQVADESAERIRDSQKD